MMKKILFVLILAFTVLEAKPCMTDIYFGNGVWNTRAQTIESKNALKSFMLDQAVTRLDPQKEGTDYVFKYAYNPSHGTREDLIETFWQLKESGQISEGYFGAVYAALTWEENTKLYNKLSDIVSKYRSDVVTMFNLYQTSSFNQKHNVLLVAHSQGNLFGNKMYTLLNNKQKAKFRMVSVGTPADHVMETNQTSPYVTLVNDPIIGSIPGSLPGNVDGFGHTFVSAYLNDSINAPRKIALYVKNAYDNLIQTNSCDTYDFYVWITYMCPGGNDQDLVVDIYGRPSNVAPPAYLQLVTTDYRKRMPKDANGHCTVEGDDIFAMHSQFNKDDCLAYSMDDTSGNYHTLDYIASHTYNNGSLCTQYKMDANTTALLKKFEAN